MSLYKSKEHTEKKSFISLKPEEETVSLNKIPAKLSLSSLSGFCHLSRTKQKVKKKNPLYCHWVNYEPEKLTKANKINGSVWQLKARLPVALGWLVMQ